MLVSGAWGVCYFKEITGARRVRKFWAGAAITFAAMLIALLPLGLRRSLRRPR